MLFGWLTESNLLDGLLSTSCVFGVVLLSGLYAFQTRLIYMPQFPPGSLRHVYRPSAFGFPKEADQEQEIITKDGVKLVGYLIRDPKADDSSPTVIYFQGNAGNIGHRLPLLARLAEELSVPVNFVLISYRGYGHSQGKPDERGLKLDAQAILDWTLEQPGINADRIILYGQSIGGAVAFDLAARNQSKVWAVIVENTFLSLPQLIPHVMPWLGPLPLYLCHQRWDTQARIQEMEDTAIHHLLLSGKEDRLVPPSHMHSIHQMVKEKARGTVHLATLPGDHVNTCAHPEYYSAIANFINTIS